MVILRKGASSDDDHDSAAMFCVNARAYDVRLWAGSERFPDLSRGALGARGKVGMKEFLNPEYTLGMLGGWVGR